MASRDRHSIRKGLGRKAKCPDEPGAAFFSQDYKFAAPFFGLSKLTSCRILFNDALIASYRANRRGYVLYHLIAEEKGEYTGKSDTPRSYTKLGSLNGDYLLGFSLIPPELNLPTHA